MNPSESARAASASIAPETIAFGTGESFLEDAQSRSDPIQRDQLYYNEPLIILVEGTLFKVSRSHFENVDVFRTTYLFGPQGEEVPDGYTDQQPLRLAGVKAANFRCLLKVIFREDSTGDLSWVEWTSVLKLSLIWHMKLITDLALQKIEACIDNADGWISALKMSTQQKIQGLRELSIRMLSGRLNSLQKIELATECSVQPWLLEGYTELVTRHEVMSVEDEEQLGWTRTSNLFRVRHRYLEQAMFSNRNDAELDIQTTFASEFDLISAFDLSTVSYLQPDLHTATDSDVIQRDEAYYHVDIIFSVENTLFKLPRYLFEESSEVFRDMFLLPAPEGMPYDGSSDEQPLILQGVHKLDFRRLLRAMKIPAKFDPRNLSGNEGESTLCNVWASALELSCMWQMDKVRDMSVKEILQLQDRLNTKDQTDLLRLSTKLGVTDIRAGSIQLLSDTLQPVEQVQLGIELQVYSWLVEGCTQLVRAQGGISLEHEKLLGRKTTSKLFRIRDEYLQKIRDRRKSKSMAGAFARSNVKEVFAGELKDAGWDGK